jgi:tRNA(Ile)-lysidine synthase
MAEPALTPSALDAQLSRLLDAPQWYVGFSGGLDSTVLLHLVQRWRRQHPQAPALSAIHVNHGLQSGADDWQLHCEWVCRVLGIPLLCHGADIVRGSAGLEAAAREARYERFAQQLGDGEVLLLAHHLDDQVETFFLRLLRGSGMQGLAAMPATRALGRGSLARPLLEIPRSRLEAYARAQGLTWVDDPSNIDTGMDRNYLRQEVLPLLARRWPGYRQTVSRASAHLAGAAASLAETLPAPDTIRSVMGDPGLSAAALRFPLPAAAALTLRHWLLAGGLPAPDRVVLDEFLRQLREAGPTARPQLACGAFTLQRHRDGVYLLPELGPPPADELTLEPGLLQDAPGAGRLGLGQVGREGLLLAPGERLRVSWRAGGERCRPRGRARSTSLKKLLQEADVPPWWRERVPLFYLEGELLAVGDLWLCESSRWSQAPQPGYGLWQPLWQRNISAAFD